jgi:hypothetical protein
VYATLTNHCNRSCPWCSTCSSPAGSTFLEPEDLWAALPAAGPFELQLEGGEPTVHPRFWDFVAGAREEPRCARLVLCTNGVALPRTRMRLRAWLGRLGDGLTFKLSINHHLLERDRGLIELASLCRDVLEALGGDRLLVLNLRLRPDAPEADRWVVDAVEDAGLLPQANVFFLQRYGFAADREAWDEPFLVGKNFRLLNPDGRLFGPELVARSEAMRVLP